MATESTWTEADFDDMSWHDNSIHALRVRAGEHGTGSLELDIDYILEWLPPADSVFSFRLAPATLTFHEAYDLKVDIDYAAVSAGLEPFAISEIKRDPHPGIGTSAWQIILNWPKGQITFSAVGYIQELRGKTTISTSQSLTHNERKALGA